jgi:anti-anti-sigma factor
MVSVSFGPPVRRGLPFRVDAQTAEPVVHLRPQGELDLASTPLLEEALIRAEETSVSAIELDLSAITFMDSCGLRGLLRAAARSNADSNRLRITGANRQVRRLVALVGVADLLPFSASSASDDRDKPAAQ